MNLTILTSKGSFHRKPFTPPCWATRWLGWMAKKSSARSLDGPNMTSMYGGFSAPSGIRIILIYQLQGIMTNHPPGTWSSFENLELHNGGNVHPNLQPIFGPWWCTLLPAWFFFAFVGSMMGTKYGDRQRVVVMTISWLWLACKIWMYYDTPTIWHCCWIMIMYHIRLVTTT